MEDFRVKIKQGKGYEVEDYNVGTLSSLPLFIRYDINYSHCLVPLPYGIYETPDLRPCTQTGHRRTDKTTCCGWCK